MQRPTPLGIPKVPRLACAAALAAVRVFAIDAWSPAPGSMDKFSVYSFSETGSAGAYDTQITHLQADLNIRTFSSWADGADPRDYNSDNVVLPRRAGITSVGGLTATVVYRKEAPSDSAFLDWISRDAKGDTLEHGEISPGAFRGNLACPGFREHLLKVVRAQVDIGAEGIFYDEVDGGFSGGAKWHYNGNEGYDDYHLKEFNRWLLIRYPNLGKADFIKMFGMDASNALDPSITPDDLSRNFNYRTYLAKKGWATNPHHPSNPLGSLYGNPVGNRMVLHADNFLDSSNTAHWREIVAASREYAKSKGQNLLVTSNGIEPFVDFNSVGLYDHNKDGANGEEVDYVPVTNGRLDFGKSLIPHFQRFRRKSEKESGGAPVVYFLDWPTANMDRYFALTPSEKMEYWRWVSFQAAASGCFFAFHLRTSFATDPTAAASGILDSLKILSDFYHKNADLFQGLEWAQTGDTSNPDAQRPTWAWQPSRHRLILYTQDAIGSASLPVLKAPKSVKVLTPDLNTTPRFSYLLEPNSYLEVIIQERLKRGIVVVELDETETVDIARMSAIPVKIRTAAGAWIIQGLNPAVGSRPARVLDARGKVLWTGSVPRGGGELRIPATRGVRFLDLGEVGKSPIRLPVVP